MSSMPSLDPLLLLLLLPLLVWVDHSANRVCCSRSSSLAMVLKSLVDRLLVIDQMTRLLIAAKQIRSQLSNFKLLFAMQVGQVTAAVEVVITKQVIMAVY